MNNRKELRTMAPTGAVEPAAATSSPSANLGADARMGYLGNSDRTPLGSMEEAVSVDQRKHVSQDKGSRRRLAAARAIRTLRMLRRLGVSAKVVGSLADGHFSDQSDVDFLVVECPRPLKYAIEGRVEDIMGGIPFDVVYRDEAREKVLFQMEQHAADDRALMRLVA